MINTTLGYLTARSISNILNIPEITILSAAKELEECLSREDKIKVIQVTKGRLKKLENILKKEQ